jgi:hypothetical protein
MEIVLGIAAIVALFGFIKIYRDKKKRERLMAKYNDSHVVEMIMQHKVWQGMSAEQLVESWGRPADTDHKVYKTKTTDIYKYNQTGKNRFRSRVRVENGVVVGWDQK